MGFPSGLLEGIYLGSTIEVLGLSKGSGGLVIGDIRKLTTVISYKQLITMIMKMLSF